MSCSYFDLRGLVVEVKGNGGVCQGAPASVWTRTPDNHNDDENYNNHDDDNDLADGRHLVRSAACCPARARNLGPGAAWGSSAGWSSPGNSQDLLANGMGELKVFIELKYSRDKQRICNMT